MKSLHYIIYVQNPKTDVFDCDYFKKLKNKTKDTKYYLSKKGIYESKHGKLYDTSFITDQIEYKTLSLLDQNNKVLEIILQKINYVHNEVFWIPIDHIELKCTEVRWIHSFFDIVKRREIIQEKTFQRIFIELKSEMNDYVLNDLRTVLLLFHSS